MPRHPVSPRPRRAVLLTTAALARCGATAPPCCQDVPLGGFLVVVPGGGGRAAQILLRVAGALRARRRPVVLRYA